MNEVEFLKRALQITPSSVHIFGNDEDKAHSFYLDLSKQLHPDSGGTVEAFQFLQVRYTNYMRNPNEPILLREDEIAISTQDDRHEVKIVIDVEDNDLLQHEAYILTLLENIYAYRYYNQLLPRVVSSEPNKTRLMYTPADLYPTALVTLADLASFYGNEFDIRHIGWIWHRIVWALGFAHSNGVVHGAITPDNILIGPEQHDVVITNWYFSSYHQEPLKAISSKWLDLYPLAMHNPNIRSDELRYYTVPGLDMRMAAKTMMRLFGHIMPNYLRDYFASMTLPLVNTVPTDPILLEQNFNRVTYDTLGWTREYLPLQWYNWEKMRNG